MRIDGREANELRPMTMETGYVLYPEGSVLISAGNTRVLCNTTIEETVPNWMRQQGVGGGWITAEYALLPRSTQLRTQRETLGLKGRTQEIRRLVGRSLRAAVDLKALGSRTIILDCDVIQADGGTRCAAITGGYVSLVLALRKLIRSGALQPNVLKVAIAAVSVGIVGGVPLLDLCYAEDSTAQADINVVMTSNGEFVEIQGTAETAPFSPNTLDNLLQLAYQGIGELLAIQQKILADQE